MSVFMQFISNTPLLAGIAGWMVTQALKIPLHYIVTRQWDFRRMFGSGGMPSSHTASTIALSVSLGRHYGYDSPMFAVAAMFACIVMYDAAGVRRAAGKQAEIVNDIVELMSREHDLPDEQLKELIGHTPLQVMVGGILGVIVGLIL